MTDTSDNASAEFDSGPWATITTGMKTLSKRGRVIVAEGHVGLLRENGDLIDSAPAASVEVKKGFTYSMSSIPTLVLGGKKYRVMLSYEHAIAHGLDDAQAKENQLSDNERFIRVIRGLGGKG